MTHGTRLLLVGLALGLVSLIVFVLSSSDLGPQRSLTAILQAPQGATSAEFTTTQTALEARLQFMGYQRVSVTLQGDGALAIQAAPSTNSERNWRDDLDLITRIGGVQMRQVIGYPRGHQLTCDGAGCPDPSLDQADVFLMSSEGDVVLHMGPVLLTEAAIARTGIPSKTPEPVMAVYPPGSTSDRLLNVIYTREGALQLATITSDLSPQQNGGVGQQLAIISEGRVITAPTVMDEITSGEVQLSASSERSRADLAFLLSNPALPFALRTVSYEQ